MSISNISGPLSIGDGGYESVTLSKQLDARKDDGKVFGLNLVGGLTVTLPRLSAVKKGFQITFRVEIPPSGGDYAIETHADNPNAIFGHNLSANALGGDVGTSGDTAVLLVSTTAALGDLVTFTTNGLVWYANGRTALASGLTFFSV